MGTGNYNVWTATQYTDLDLFTDDPLMGQDASELFNLLTGYAEAHDYDRFLVAPTTLRAGLRGARSAARSSTRERAAAAG